MNRAKTTSLPVVLLGLLAALLGFAALLSPAFTDDGGTESPFSFGAGARDLGLGGSAINIPDPATAVFWNPSALATGERTAFEAFHSRLYETNSVYQYLGASMPTMDMGTFGVGLFRLGTDAIERRDENNMFLGLIEDNRTAMYLGYGRTVSGYDLGLAVALEHHSLDAHSATSSPGLNLSVRRQLVTSTGWLPEMSASLCGRNLVRPRIKLAGEAVSLPLALDAAVSMRFVPNPAWKHNVTLSAGVSKVDMLDPRFMVGLEYDVQEFLHVRGALRDGDPSFGAGLSYRFFNFDYAYTERDLGSLHMFSISAGLGMAMSEKRIAREAEREAEFNQVINRSLSSRNQEMFAGLIANSEDLIAQGSLDEAAIVLDRALFLAAGSGLDTTEMFWAAQEMARKLGEQTKKKAFEAYMDSAWSKLSSGDYLDARYFAEQASVEFPKSLAATNLLDQIDRRVKESASNEIVIESQIMLVDSLTTYGKHAEALAAAQSLNRITDDPRIDMVLKKAGFGFWKDRAERAFARAEYESARGAVDSALVRFPDHPWGLALESRIDDRINRSRETARQAEASRPKALSEELLKEVDLAYKDGQTLFEEGNLWDAVASWERVESLAPDYKSVREYLVDAYKFLGVELYTKNRLEDAVDIWKKGARLDPESSELSNYIRRTEGEISRLEEISYDFN